MDYCFPPPLAPNLPVVGMNARFPVRRIFCVGRNYAEHAREMGMNPERDPPFFFTKPADAVVEDGQTVAYPPETRNFQHEAELVVAIGKAGREIPEDLAHDHIFGYAIGNDLTRRDLQLAAREAGRPWDWGKAFDRSAVIGPIHPVAEVGHPSQGVISLSVNGTVRQQADLADLIWSVPEIVSILSRSMEIRPGDLVMTGTPAGVGALLVGDVCVVSIDGLGQIVTTIVPRV
jgi:fumarylpyruvate hydrolase